MKIVLALIFCLTSVSLSAQIILGKWQLLKQSTCIEAQLDSPDQSEDLDRLLADKNSMKTRTPSIVEFKPKMKGLQSTSVLGKRKTVDDKTFLYKLDGNTLYLLDKKSKTIIFTYTVEELTKTSLTLSETSRPCEVRVFERIQ
jgi:hypothetical protein